MMLYFINLVLYFFLYLFIGKSRANWSHYFLLELE